MSPPPPPAAGDALVLPPPSALERLRARGRLRTTLTLLGPAFVAAIAYVDPGNFATNIAGGAKYGYLLLWVILAANLMAMLIQNLSAKVGIATGKNLPELCRERFPKPVTWGLWVQAELIAMATDLAEFIGAAIALNLLFGVPLFVAGLMTAVVAFGILALQQRGYRKFELAIGALLALILLGFLYDTLSVAHDVSGIARGFIPSFAGTDSCCWPPASSARRSCRTSSTCTRRSPRTGSPRATTASAARCMRFGKRRRAHRHGRRRPDQHVDADRRRVAVPRPGVGHRQIEGAYAGFEKYAGAGAALAFALALLASGFASSSVGTYSGQVVMQGFIARTIPLALRRLVTMAPALIVLAIGLNPSRALVISQVVLSFGIPFALVPLVLLSSKREVMGSLVNARLTTIVAWVVAALITGLNLFLLSQTFFG